MKLKLEALVLRYLCEAKGWKQYGVLILLGAITALAMPPVGWVFVLFITFPLLLSCLDTHEHTQRISRIRAGDQVASPMSIETYVTEGESRRSTHPKLERRRVYPSFWRAFLQGWSFSLGYFVAGLYWLVVALSVDWQRFFWLTPFTLLGLPSILAIFQGLAAAATHSSRMSGISRCFAFAVFWTLFEWLRGHLFTGFPWNLIGYAWDPVLPMLQFTAFTGIYGLSLVTVLMASLPAVWLTSTTFRKRIASTAILALLGVSLWGLGTWRLTTATLPDNYEQQQRDTVLRIVQPNIPQSLKWDPTKARENFLKLLSLSRMSSTLPITDLVWPESALPVFLDEDHTIRNIIGEVIPPHGTLLTGAIRRYVHEGRTQQIWTSLMALNKKGEILGFYDKAHLVPFGEYIPFRAYLPQWIRKLTPGDLDYSPGAHMKTFTLSHTYSLPTLPPFSPLVCYEAIFPGEVVNKSDKRPQWLVNITNDAWYGMTSGPYQHFAMVRVRAIEEGLPLIRAANNGISGAVDAYGHIIGTLDLGKTGVLDVVLPPALKSPTLYSRGGDWIFLVLILGISLVAVICRWFKI